jgi:hypothetical protein
LSSSRPSPCRGSCPATSTTIKSSPPPDLIVSGDRKHLLPLGSHAGIAIVEVAEALRRIGTE